VRSINAPFEHFYTKTDQLTKTGSGQTYEKYRKKVFSSGAELLSWGGINCFFMAEGNYPFASTYIPFSMGIGA
jgi:hypothetical protein